MTKKSKITSQTYCVFAALCTSPPGGMCVNASSWHSMNTAPLYEEVFLCRHKSSPHITFEAFISRESESYEMPKEYDVLNNHTYPEDILDDSWDMYEWQPLPEGAVE